MNLPDFIERINSFVETQLAVWPDARSRYMELGKIERKSFRLGDLEGAVQFNPGRVRSTVADVSEKAIGERPCFLCGKNRPVEQISVPIRDGWEMLLNPFPIFPIHFTIASKTHRPQIPDLPEMIAIAEQLTGMTVFFNGAKAGASAPDHMHFQAVLTCELPLMKYVEEKFRSNKSELWTVQKEEGTQGWPYAFRTALIRPDNEGMDICRRLMVVKDPELLNRFVWPDADGVIRIVDIPRRAHRPACYMDPENPLMISPGAIDMAGVVIAVRPEDFDRTPDRMAEIYGEVAFDNL